MQLATRPCRRRGLVLARDRLNDRQRVVVRRTFTAPIWLISSKQLVMSQFEKLTRISRHEKMLFPSGSRTKAA